MSMSAFMSVQMNCVSFQMHLVCLSKEPQTGPQISVNLSIVSYFLLFTDSSEDSNETSDPGDRKRKKKKNKQRRRKRKRKGQKTRTSSLVGTDSDDGGKIQPVASEQNQNTRSRERTRDRTISTLHSGLEWLEVNFYIRANLNYLLLLDQYLIIIICRWRKLQDDRHYISNMAFRNYMYCTLEMLGIRAYSITTTWYKRNRMFCFYGTMEGHSSQIV